MRGLLILGFLFSGLAALACPDVRCDLCVPPGTHTCRIIDCFGDIKSTFTENCAVTGNPAPVPVPVPVTPGQPPPPPILPPPLPHVPPSEPNAPNTGPYEPGKIYACPFDCAITCGEAHTGTHLNAYGATPQRAKESALSICDGDHFEGATLCHYHATFDRCYPTDP